MDAPAGAEQHQLYIQQHWGIYSAILLVSFSRGAEASSAGCSPDCCSPLDPCSLSFTAEQGKKYFNQLDKCEAKDSQPVSIAALLADSPDQQQKSWP